MGKNTVGVIKEMPVAKSHCLTSQKKIWKLSVDLDSGSQCFKGKGKCQKMMPGEFLLLGAGSIPSRVCFFPHLCSVTMERREELGASCHSSALDAGLRAEPSWHSTTSLSPPPPLAARWSLFLSWKLLTIFLSPMASRKRVNFRLVVWETSSFSHHFLHWVQEGSKVLAKLLPPFFCKEGN